MKPAERMGKGFFRAPVLLFLAAAALAAGCLSLPGRAAGPAPGISYEFLELTAPVPNEVHVLRISLCRDELVTAVVLSENPPGDDFNATLTDPLRLAARNQDTIAFVNTNPWSPWPPPAGERRALITGLAASDGEIRSPPMNPSVWFEPGRVLIGDPGETFPAEGVGTWRGSTIVSDGRTTRSTGGARHPRTAIGRDESGTVLFLVVVDGRRPGESEGMTLAELAGLMQSLGCREAVNMDGGGSSIIALDKGRGLRVLNRPSDGRRRPLPLLLTIRRTGQSPAPAGGGY